MEQRDRDMLIRIDENLKFTKENQILHKQETKEVLFGIQGELINLRSEIVNTNTRLTKLEEQRKPMLFKFLSWLFMAKGG